MTQKSGEEIGVLRDIVELLSQVRVSHRDMVDQLHDLTMAAGQIARGLEHIASAIEAARPGGTSNG